MEIIFASKLSSASREFDAASGTDQANLAGNSGASWSEKRNAKNKDFASLIAGIGVLIIGGIGVGWSFTF
jgi:hypothetical protein